MSTTTKLSNYESRKNVEQKPYRSMIRSLLYLTMCRLDISFSIGAYARYQANLKESYLTTVKRIIHYINGTLDYGLWYSHDSSFVIARYSNVDWAENVENRKTHLVLIFLLMIVLWLGSVRNKTLYPYLQPKLSILLLGAIVRNSYGSNKCSNTMELRKGHEHAL